MARMANIDNVMAITLIAQGLSQRCVTQSFGVHESSIAVLFRHAIATERLDQKMSTCGHNVKIKAYVSY